MARIELPHSLCELYLIAATIDVSHDPMARPEAHAVASDI
jgi:hypothetical protein